MNEKLNESKKEKVVLSSEKEKNIVEYIAKSDLTKSDIIKMDSINFIIRRDTSRKSKNMYYRATIIFSDRLEVSLSISKTQWYLIIDQLDLDDSMNSHNLRCKIRLIEGITNKENKWLRYELFVISGLTFSGFLTNEDSDLFYREIKRGAIDLKIFESKEVLSDDEYLSQFDKAFNNDI